MKLLLILGDDETYKRITHYIRPLGFEFIRYTYALKAMDNIDEIEPDAIIISAQDYPRHWKVVVNFVRNERSKDDCPFIVLKGENFPVEEASKASFLGVSGIIFESLDNAGEISRLQGILSRYAPVDEKRRAHRYYPQPHHRFGFTFVHPESRVLITGEVKDVSSCGLSFEPDNAQLQKNLSLNMEISECSLRTGDRILSPVCRIRGMGKTLSLGFFSFPKGEQETLNDYLDSLYLKELEQLSETNSENPHTDV